MLQPTTRATTTNTATCPRVSDREVQRPMVINNNNNTNVRPPRVNNDNDVPTPRVLRPRAKIHQQKYPQGIRVYRIFGEPNRLVEHQGYICDFEKKERYYKVKYQDSNTEEYDEEEIINNAPQNKTKHEHYESTSSNKT